MKRIFILALLGCMLFMGCAKTEKPAESPAPSAPAVSSEQGSQQGESAAPSAAPNGKQPTMNDLEALTKKLDETKDPKEREKILAEIQVILDQAEKNAPKQSQ